MPDKRLSYRQMSALCIPLCGVFRFYSESGTREIKMVELEGLMWVALVYASRNSEAFSEFSDEISNQNKSNDFAINLQNNNNYIDSWAE